MAQNMLKSRINGARCDNNKYPYKPSLSFKKIQTGVTFLTTLIKEKWGYSYRIICKLKKTHNAVKYEATIIYLHIEILLWWNKGCHIVQRANLWITNQWVLGYRITT